MDASPEDKYIASLYWTVMTLTTVGYGDIAARNTVERVVCGLVMLGGVFFYSYTIGVITSIISERDRQKAKLSARILVLNDIAKKYKLSEVFYRKLKRALEYQQRIMRSERAKLLQYIPKKMANQLAIIMNKSLIRTNDFFQGKPMYFVAQVLKYLRPMSVKPKEIIYQRGDFSEEMYFITFGEVGLYIEYLTDNLLFELLTDSDYFGDIEIFLANSRKFMTKAVRYTELLTLSSDELSRKVLNLFPDVRMNLLVEAHTRNGVSEEKQGQAIEIFLNNQDLLSTIANIKNTQDPELGKASSQSHNSLKNSLKESARAMFEYDNDSEELQLLETDIKTLRLRAERIQECLDS